MSVSSSFQKSFKGDIVTPTDPDYQTAIARWASNAQRNAKIVAFAKDAEDVSLAIRYAKENHLPIAIRGGGHSASGGSSSEDGIVIDLSRYLRDVTVDAEKRVAFVGGGATWETVDKTAIQHGLAAVAGTVNHTGVGGLTLGGGYGWLSPSHGLVIDNLIQVTIVIADGSILTANATENPDLFWAIRGGGCNFGIVTEFVFNLHPQRRTVYAGILIFPPTALESIATFSENWWARGPLEKEGMIQIFTRGPDGNPAIIVVIFYNGSEEEGRANWKEIFDLQPVVDMTKEIPYEELNAISNPYQPHGLSTYVKGTFQTKPRVEVHRAAFDKVLELSEERPKMQIGVGFDYFSLRKVYSVPGDATAFKRSPYPMAMNIVRWSDDQPGDLEFAKNAVHEVLGIVKNGNVDLPESKRDVIGYTNYDPAAEMPQVNEEGTVFNDVAPEAFGANYPRLQQLKKKYDPERLFSKWFVITPA